MPKNQYNTMLQQLLDDLGSTDGISGHKARLMLVGSALDDPEWVRIIEALGGLVVTDALCFGARYFAAAVDEKRAPLEALTERYLSRVPCPRMADGYRARVEYIKEMVETYHLDGLILERIKFCDLWSGEAFMLRSDLKELGIPFLELEREYILSGAGAMKTRVQAFIESIEG